MYYLNNLEELTNDKMVKIINAFKGHELPQLQKYKQYYEGNQQILSKYNSDDTKPCNKLVANYCYDIVENYNGYISGIPISYSSAEDISDILDILAYNDVHNEDSELLRNALTYGVAYELYYLDEMAQQRFKVINSEEMIPIYKNDLEEELLAVMRLYSANDLDDISATFIDVYTDKEILKYKSDSSFTTFNLIDVKPHYYGQVPVTVFNLNNDSKSVFDRVISLQDAYNKLLSANVDDYEAFVDSYLVLVGYSADDEALKEMKENRVLLLDSDGDASFLIKNSDNSMVDGLLDRLNNQIQKIAKCPDFNDEKFLSQSGVAIRYKLVGMENNASSIESNMRKALLRRLELICAIQKLTATELGWRDIEIVFTRNLPVDLTESVSLVNQLRGLVSDRTLLSQIPFVTNPDEELELLTAQNESNPVYDFNYEEEN